MMWPWKLLLFVFDYSTAISAFQPVRRRSTHCTSFVAIIAITKIVMMTAKSESVANAGHDRRHRCRQDDLEKDFSFFGAEGARHLDKDAVDLFHPGHGVDDDDKDCKQEHDSDARLHAETEPQDQHRHEGGGRRGH